MRDYRGYMIDTLDDYNFADVYKDGELIGTYYNIDIAIYDIDLILQSTNKD